MIDVHLNFHTISVFSRLRFFPTLATFLLAFGVLLKQLQLHTQKRNLHSCIESFTFFSFKFTSPGDDENDESEEDEQNLKRCMIRKNSWGSSIILAQAPYDLFLLLKFGGKVTRDKLPDLHRLKLEFNNGMA